MPKKDPKARKQYLQNTHDAYRLFYTVLLTIGLSLGFDSVIGILGPLPLSKFGTKIPMIFTFGVFLLVVLRFFLGGIRHLDQTYLETDFEEIKESRVSSQRFRAIDIGLLVFDAGVIIILGGLLGAPRRFFTVLVVLLFVDALWALLVSYRLDDLETNGKWTPRTKWGINNSVHFVFLLIALCVASWPWLVLLGFTNPFVDLKWTFDSYFPPL
jgi:hypothetical protein